MGFGAVDLSSDDDNAGAEVTADEKMFKFGAKGIVQLAAIGQTLKMVKNFWINKNADSSDVSMEGQPFFAWNAKISDMVDGGSAATAPVYSGYGMYVKLSKMTDLNFDKSCPASGTPSQTIQLFPPSDIPWVTINNDGSKTANKTISATVPFDNSSPSRQSQNGKSVCNGSGTGFYLRDDGSSNYMANWGTGGSLQNSVPTGYFTFKLDSTYKGAFDISSGYPLETGGISKVPVPRMSLTKDGNGNVTAFTIKFAIYNFEKKAYEDMTDMGLFKRMATSVGGGFNVGNGSGSDESRATTDGEGTSDISIAWSADGLSLVGTITSASKKLPVGSSYFTSNKITSFYASYIIGGSSYRFSFNGY